MTGDGPRCWAVVPAAGSGSRMGQGTPKQYLTVGGQTILGLTVAGLLAEPRIECIVVAVAPDDDRVGDVLGDSRRVRVATGGKERAESVEHGLQALDADAAEDDWVLVHDAARPLLPPGDLTRLLDTLADHPVGVLLAVPVSDTLKQADADGQVARTVPRDSLWSAMTPQMFRFGLLSRALESARAGGVAVTDEASAMERAGFRPVLVPGRRCNIKITRPEDLEMAEALLRHRESLA